MNAQPSLFDAPAEPERYKHPDFFNMHAREKMSLPDGWRWYRAERLPEGGPSQVFRLTGCVPNGVHTKGKRKGGVNYDDGTSKREVYLPIPEHRAWCHAWHIANNKCEECHGEMRIVVSVHVTEGTTYRPCVACGETGVYQGDKPCPT